MRLTRWQEHRRRRFLEARLDAAKLQGEVTKERTGRLAAEHKLYERSKYLIKLGCEQGLDNPCVVVTGTIYPSELRMAWRLGGFVDMSHLIADVAQQVADKAQKVLVDFVRENRLR